MRVYDPIDVRISSDLSNEERAYEIFKRCWINQHIDDITMTQTEAQASLTIFALSLT